MKTQITQGIFAILLIVSSCTPQKKSEETTHEPASKPTGTATVDKGIYGNVDGQEVTQYTLKNDNGLIVKIINYGGIITEIHTPDKDGEIADITLGFDSLEEYIKSSPYFGATIGRYGNRIANGKFFLDGNEYTMAVNNGDHHLHGGLVGFDKVIWEAEIVETGDAARIRMHYLSKDGEEGYPGNLDVYVTFSLNNDDELAILYEATTNKTTHVNLTNHTYFNFNGGASSILDHELMINANAYLPVDEGLIPTGEQRPVEGGPFDFTSFKTIGQDIADVPGGYDHNFILVDGSDSLKLTAKVQDPVTGRTMEILTTEPGVQFYAGNFLDGLPGKSGKVYDKHFGFCLETQHFPDSPNQTNFPSTVLKPGEKYSTHTVHKFGVKK